MFIRNKELKGALGVFLLIGILFLPIGFLGGCFWGLCLLLCWGLCLTCFIIVEHKRYQRLQKFSDDLEAIVLHGKTLPMEAYEEGELSLLAHQIQKLTYKLTEAQKALQKDKVFLADSLADISHQLRTPLTAMQLTLSLLRKPEADERSHKAQLRDFQTLLNRTQWLVEALLKLSKLDAGTISFHRENVSLREILSQATEPFAIPMELYEQQLTIKCDDCTVVCDPIWTGEAIGNILKNAMEHNPPGGTIVLSGRDTPIFTEITVEDQGGGFSPEELPRIFERFYCGNRENSKNCGIGLSLARSIIAAQNGTVQAENHGLGARFTIKFYKSSA